jgi:hypothetical protein
MDEMSRIIFVPEQKLDSLQPVWTYNDDNSSILYPDVTVNRDLFDIPNVIEVVYSSGSFSHHDSSINDDPTSITSTVNRGRKITYRDTNPNIMGVYNKEQAKKLVKDYADRLLASMSTLECRVTYTHGYCPTRLGDCVRLNYSRADLSNVKAKVVSQSIKCTADCPVTETAIFPMKLWR